MSAAASSRHGWRNRKVKAGGDGSRRQGESGSVHLLVQAQPWRRRQSKLLHEQRFDPGKLALSGDPAPVAGSGRFLPASLW